jgi:hypothetical protein
MAAAHLQHAGLDGCHKGARRADGDLYLRHAKRGISTVPCLIWVSSVFPHTVRLSHLGLEREMLISCNSRHNSTADPWGEHSGTELGQLEQF